MTMQSVGSGVGMGIEGRGVRLGIGIGVGSGEGATVGSSGVDRAVAFGISVDRVLAGETVGAAVIA